MAPLASEKNPQKEWRHPVLRKLPISATSLGPNPKGTGNEGVGTGKGDNVKVS
jgi:hypothetical protein